MNKEMLDYVLHYPKIKERMEGSASANHDRERVIKNLKELAADFHPEAILQLKFLIEKTVLKLYTSIDFEVPADMDVINLVKNNSVVFVPNHQSHADYLLLNYLLFTRYGISAFIAGGINLNIFPIGPLFRRAGCFFIRRAFNNDIMYKLTLEAYISFLLYEGRSIEFFYEGGRSRTGKLLPPKFGLFQILIETHRQLPAHLRKPLVFVPVSLVHEHVPEQRGLTSESKGAKKKKESFAQLIQLYKFFGKQLGTIHLKFNEPIFLSESEEEVKKTTQRLAFECYRCVGKGMMLTPSSLLSMVLLDSEQTGITWEEIKAKALAVLRFCQKFNLPLSRSLRIDQNDWQYLLLTHLNLMKKDRNVIEEKGPMGEKDLVYYRIPKERRLEILYSKNTIIHHFIVPFFINAAWIGVFLGRIRTTQELKVFFIEKRKQLKYEFYLPTMKELFYGGLNIASQCVGRKIESLEDCLSLSRDEILKLGQHVGVFANTFRFIYEAQYVGLSALKYFNDRPFTRDQFEKTNWEIFQIEFSRARVVKHIEAYSTQMVGNALALFRNQNMVISGDSKFWVIDHQKVNEYLKKYADDLEDLSNISVKEFGVSV